MIRLRLKKFVTSSELLRDGYALEVADSVSYYTKSVGKYKNKNKLYVDIRYGL
jgi:hypothetical protein